MYSSLASPKANETGLTRDPSWAMQVAVRVSRTSGWDTIRIFFLQVCLQSTSAVFNRSIRSWKLLTLSISRVFSIQRQLYSPAKCSYCTTLEGRLLTYHGILPSTLCESSFPLINPWAYFVGFPIAPPQFSCGANSGSMTTRISLFSPRIVTQVWRARRRGETNTRSNRSSLCLILSLRREVRSWEGLLRVQSTMVDLRRFACRLLGWLEKRLLEMDGLTPFILD